MAANRENIEHSVLDTSIFDNGFNNSKKQKSDIVGLLSFIVPKKGKKRKFFVFMLLSLILFLVLNIMILTRQHGKNYDSSENGIQFISEIDRYNQPPNYTLITREELFMNNNTHSFQFVNMSKILRKGEKAIDSINITVVLLSQSEFRIIIDSTRHERFKIPYNIFNFKEGQEESETKKNPALKISELQYDIYIDKERMSFKIARNSTNETLFEVRTNDDFFFQETFSEFTTYLPNRYLYGLGQQRQKFLYQPGMYYIWGRGDAGPKGSSSAGHHLYGNHPMYLQRENSTLFHIVYLNNLNPKSLEFLTDPASLKFKIIGGAIDLSFFLSDGTPGNVLEDYHKRIGGWRAPTFKMLGVHMGFRGLNQFESEALANDMNLPKLDFLWIDALNITSYNENDMSLSLTNILSGLDFGFPLDSKLGRELLENEALIYSSKTQKPLLSCVEGVVTVFPDYNHVDIKKILAENLLNSLSQHISGIFLINNEPHTDMKEPEIDLERVEECSPNFKIDAPLLEKINNSLVSYGSSFQFTFSELQGADSLHAVENYTVSLDSFHNSFDGGRFLNLTDLSFLQEINLHSLNSLMQAQTVFQSIVLDQKNKDSFVFSEGTSPGIGRYSGYFARSLKPTWGNLQTVISELLNFQLFGIPIVAVPSCGSESHGLSTSSEELCARWLQLSTVLPVLIHYSNENKSVNNDSKQQNNSNTNYLYSLMTKSYKKLLHSSFLLRIALTPYIWSTYALQSPFGAVYKPVFFEFTHDVTLLEIDNQFFIGSALMFAAVVTDSKESIDVYFPRGVRFVNLFKNESYINSVGIKTEVSCELEDDLPVFLREGYAVALLNVNNSNLKLSILNQEYSLFCFFTQSEDSRKFTAKGYIPGVQPSYNSDNSDAKECGKDCILNIEVVATVADTLENEEFGAGYDIDITFKKVIENGNAHFGKVYLTGARFFGLKNKSKILSKNWIDAVFEKGEASPNQRISIKIYA